MFGNQKSARFLLAILLCGVVTVAGQACEVSVEQTTSSSWNNNGDVYTLVQVEIKNTGTSNVLGVTLKVEGDFDGMWEMAGAGDDLFVLPEWRSTSPLQPDQVHSWGYIIKSSSQARMSVNNVDCDGSNRPPPPTQSPPTQSPPTQSPPTQTPTQIPTQTPTNPPPTITPTLPPTQPPTNPPTQPPTNPPTQPPTNPPTQPPTQPPTNPPTQPPTNPPTQPPTNPPTRRPTSPPTQPPTQRPTPTPTNPPPTLPPTTPPTQRPTPTPTPTRDPCEWPYEDEPTNPPTSRPTNPPTSRPTNPPTSRPTNPPTNPPTSRPTNPPTSRPTNPPTSRPTNPPTSRPTNPPTSRPTNAPTSAPGIGRICPEGSIWSPAPGTTWQWQITDKVDTSVDVQMYDIDLFSADAATINTLHRAGRAVVCYFSTQYEDWRPDAKDFPSSVLGSDLDDWEGEKYVDIRSSTVRNIMKARLDLAKSKGCDGVEPDNVDSYSNSNGLGLTANDQIDYNKFLASESHKRGLSVGLKNDLSQVRQLVSFFDWALNEQCNQYDECDDLSPFVTANKAVFGVEYTGSVSSFCPAMKQLGFSWLKKELHLGAAVTQCCTSTGGCNPVAHKCLNPTTKRSVFEEEAEMAAQENEGETKGELDEEIAETKANEKEGKVSPSPSHASLTLPALSAFVVVVAALVL